MEASAGGAEGAREGVGGVGYHCGEESCWCSYAEEGAWYGVLDVSVDI